MKRLKTLGFFFASIVICITALAQTSQKNNSQISFVGPEILEGGKLFACGKKSHSSRCLTASIPPELGAISGVVPLNRKSDSTVYWELVTKKTVAVCGMNFKAKKAACSPVSDLRAALNDAAKFQNEAIADIIQRYKPHLNAAIRVVSTNVADNATKNGSSTTSFRPLEQIDDGGWGDSGGGGGGGGDGGSGGGGDSGDVPVVVVIGNPDAGDGDGGGNDGGADSGNPAPVSTEPSPPPGASNNESPARAKCMASAYAVWLIEDAVCRSQKNYSDYKACNDFNWREYNISRDLCVQQFP